MKKWFKENLFMMIVLIFFGLTVASVVTTTEDIIVKGVVVDVIEHDDHLEIFMDNGYDYKITYPEDAIDLTVNSKIILKLTNTNWFWIDDGIWVVDSIVKVPNTDYGLKVYER